VVVEITLFVGAIAFNYVENFLKMKIKLLAVSSSLLSTLELDLIVYVVFIVIKEMKT